MIPLVLVHGFMGGSDQWADQQELAQARDLICVDLPGFGRNAHLPPIDRIDGFAEWVLAELRRQGVERFDLLGHSMGGMIVQDMVRQAPSRINRLILYGTGPIGVLPGRFETIETSIRRAEEDGAKPTARRISATWFLHRDKAAGYPACAAIAEKSALNAIQAGLHAMQGWSGEAHLPDITAQTLVIWGAHDRTYPWSQAEALWRRIPNSDLAVVPRCAHAVHAERPRIFNLLVAEFLEDG